MKRLISAITLLAMPGLSHADAIGGEVQRQPLNIQAIIMFFQTHPFPWRLLHGRWPHYRAAKRVGDCR